MSERPLETRDLAIGYRRRAKTDAALAHGLNLRLQKGELVGLLGPNGVGKSTLLRTLAGLRKPLAGRVLLEGQDLRTLAPAQIARQLSLVLTAAPKPGMMNGYALVALGRHPHCDWLGRLTESDHEAIGRAIAAVGAEDLVRQPLAELSDGQRQKLMIARALAQETRLMLLDEPTAYLDLPRRVETMQLLRRLARTRARAILVSTHDLELALRNCDRLWLMRDSRLETGAPEDLVLRGSLGAAFNTNGIKFDAGSGAFVTDSPAGLRVTISGGGEKAIWMRRALERSGYTIDDARGEIEIDCLSTGGATSWRLRVAGRASRHGSIQAVLDALEGEKDPR